MRVFVLFFMLLGSLYAQDSANLLNQGNMFASNQNFKEAARYFQQAVDLNNTEAKYNLGYLYSTGLGVDNNLTKAYELYLDAAKDGHTNAQVNLGFVYLGGQGVGVDYEQAAFWMKKAKDTGNQKAVMLWEEFKLQNYFKGSN